MLNTLMGKALDPAKFSGIPSLNFLDGGKLAGLQVAIILGLLTLMVQVLN